MYVFVGLLYPSGDVERVLKKSHVGIQAAANQFQWGLLKGLYENCKEDIIVLNSVPNGSWPKYSGILIEKNQVTDSDNIKIHSFGYINLPVIKQIQRKKAIFNNLRKIIETTTEEVTVILYSFYAPYLKALEKLKKKNYKFNYILILPDMPGKYGVNLLKTLKGKVKLLWDKIAIRRCRQVDGYIFLTEKMSEIPEFEHKPYRVIEGIYSNTGKESNRAASYHRLSPPIILYTGTLARAEGLDILIDAFQKLPPGSSRLLLAGAGTYVDELKNICKKFPDIEYLGYLPKHKISKLQKSASILVNPRSADEIYTQYSFPSKTMEYLASGVPVVMNKLPCIPPEYSKHLFFTERSDADSLSETLWKVLNMDEKELNLHGILAAEFIRTEKNSQNQVRKLVDLTDELKNKDR